MINETSVPDNNRAYLVNSDIRFHHSLCWKAIFAGVVTAIGIHLLLLALGAGIGLAVFTPLTDPNPAENFTVGSAIAWSVCALISLYVGGWIAGCFSAGPKTGSLHGIIVWSVTMIIMFSLVSGGGGMALGGAFKALGAGMNMMGKTASGGVSAITQQNLKKGDSQITSFVDEAVKSSPTNATPAMSVRANREIGSAVAKLFAPGSDINSATNRDAVVKTLTQYAGMSDADAKKMVDEWTTSYNELKADLENAKTQEEQKAREVADKAAHKLAEAATISFFAFLVGLILTICGGICGAKRTVSHTTLGRITTS